MVNRGSFRKCLVTAESQNRGDESSLIFECGHRFIWPGKSDLRVYLIVLYYLNKGLCTYMGHQFGVHRASFHVVILREENQAKPAPDYCYQTGPNWLSLDNRGCQYRGQHMVRPKVPSYR